MKSTERMKLVSLQMKDLSDAMDDRERAIKNHSNGMPYEPSNCRWATYKEQANNRRNRRSA